MIINEYFSDVVLAVVQQKIGTILLKIYVLF